jgi:nucleoside-diphosphate-sugar epimerase
MFALVTGASGLLGKSLTGELIHRGHHVRGLDIKEPDSMPEGLEFIEGDVRNADVAQRVCKGIDTVFHLAALLPQTKSPKDRFHSVNVGGTENMLSAAVSESVKRFVFASSIEIYGIPDRVPCTEDDPKKLLGEYSRNKLECEELCAKYSADFGIEVVMIRMPMIFGPGYWHEKFYLRMFEDLSRGKSIRLIGTGENRHQVVACSDATKAFILAAETPGAAGEAFNIASDPATVLSVRETAEQVIQRVGSNSKLAFVNRSVARILIRLMSLVRRPLLLDEHREVPFVEYVFDIEKARQVLGYVPEKDDVDAIAETAEWYCELSELPLGDSSFGPEVERER